jgi:hypothetical protein
MAVYFIACREIGMVKIGTAYDPFARMRTLQVAFPLDLTVEALFVGAHRREREYHRQFAEHRVRGEWFRLCPEIEELIAGGVKPQRPRSEAQKRRLRQMHADPRPLGPETPPKHMLDAWRAAKNKKPLPPSFMAPGFTKEERRRIQAGDITFPFRTKELATT